MNLSLVLFAFMLFNCESKKASIDEETFIRIMIQIHTAEAKASHSMLMADSSRYFYKKEEDKIFEKFGVTRDQFKESYRFYAKNPKKLDDLYTSIVDSLSLRESLRKLEF